MQYLIALRWCTSFHCRQYIFLFSFFFFCCFQATHRQIDVGALPLLILTIFLFLLYLFRDVYMCASHSTFVYSIQHANELYWLICLKRQSRRNGTSLLVMSTQISHMSLPSVAHGSSSSSYIYIYMFESCWISIFDVEELSVTLN